MDKQSFSLVTKIIPIITMIWIGIIICNDAVGETEINLSDIDKQNIQKLFTHKEKDWLSEHKTIRIAGPKAFPPFHYYEKDGTLKGLASDYILLILNYLNIQPDIQRNMEWPKVLKGVEDRKIDLISCTAKSIERESYLWFTEPYLSFPLVIIAKTDSPFIGGMGDLHDKKVAFIKGAAAYDWIGRDNVKIIPYFVKTPLDGLRAVSLGSAEAHIENLATSSYLIQKNGLANLKIAAPAFNENYNLYIAVRKDWPEMISIINKTLTAITPQQHSQIRDRWLSIEYDYGIRKAEVIKWILGISCIFITIFAVILMWNRRLRREIHGRKQAEKIIKTKSEELEAANEELTAASEGLQAKEQSLLNEKIFAEALLECLPGYLYVYDDQGNLVRWNKKHETMTGYSAEELSHKNLSDWFEGEDAVRVAAAVDEVFTIGYGEIEAHLLIKGGEKLFIHSNGVRLTIDGKTYFVGVGIDITDQKLAEEAIKKNESLQRKMVANIGDVIVIIDQDGINRYKSPNIEKLFGWKPEDVVGSSTWENIHPYDLDSTQKFFGNLIREPDTVGTMECRYKCKDGSYRWIQFTGSNLLHDPDIQGVLGNYHDITKRKYSEDALEKRIIALTQPLDDPEGIAFEEIFNLADIQRLQNQFAKATGVASIITHTDGKPITEASNFCRLCNDIIRKTDKGLRNCFNSDTILGRYNPDGPIIQTCHSGGLWDAGAAISIGGKHIANWLIGQVRDETQTEEKMRSYAREIGAEEEAVVEAFREVPSMSRKQFDHVAQALFTLANQLSTTAYQNLQQARLITEIKQVEKTLRGSEKKHRELLEGLNDAAYRMSLPDGKYEYFSQSSKNVFGYDSKSWLNNPQLIGEIIHPDFIEYFNQKWVELVNGEVPESYEYKIIDPDGNERWIFQTNTGIFNDKGQIVAIEGLCRNITSHKQAEDALKESEFIFSQMFEQSTTSMCLYNPEGTIIKANKAFCEMFGVKEKSIINAGYNIFKDQAAINAGIIPLVRDIFEKMKTRNWQIDFNIDSASESTQTPTSKTGTIFLEAFGYPVLNHKGDLEFVVLQHYDITKRQRAEEALRTSEKEYRSMINDLFVGIVVHSSDTSILLSNTEAVNILGLSHEQMSGKKAIDPAWNFVHEDSSIMKIEDYPVSKVFSTKKPLQNYVAGIIRPDKDYTTWVIVNAIPVFSNNNELEKIIINFVDITALKWAEKEKMKAQKIAGEHKKLALVGQIAGKMAHDFNNILGIIMGNTELALLDCKDSGMEKTLELIFQQTLRGKNLTRNLVAFAKDQEPKQEFFRISEKINLVLNLLEKDLEGIEVIKEDKPGVPELLGDPGMIEHGLVNLIQNSIHATSMSVYPRIIIRTYFHDNDICFEIEDNGCGIPKEHIGNIFEPSFTLKGTKDVIGSYKTDIKGTGYGMANVKKYIEQHKGDIFVESAPGAGTKFTITLPVIKKALTPEEKTLLRKEITNFEKYILLVEDEQSLSDVQYRVLTQEPCNHKVDIAYNGQVAIDLFNRNEYDFVSLDYVLPGDINGIDVYKYIRKTNKTIPILFISGNIEFLESIKDLKQKDINIDHLSKPCQNKDYVNGINELLEKNIS